MVQGGARGKRDGVGEEKKMTASSMKQFRFIFRCCNCLPEGLTVCLSTLWETLINYNLNVDIANILSVSH